MPKKIIFILIAIVLLIGLVIGGYWGWTKWKASQKSPEVKTLEEAGKVAETITKSATQGTLPSLGTNPLENKPDINPADKTNPFKDIKTNPFE